MTELRGRIDARFAALAGWVFRNRIKVLLALLVVVGALMAQLPRLEADNSTEVYFHKTDPNLQSYLRFQEQFGRDEMIFVLLEPRTVFDVDFLETLRAMHGALQAEVPYLREVTSLINVRDTRGAGDELIVEDLVKETPATPEAMAVLRERVLGSHLYPNLYVSADGRLTAIVVETVAFSPGGGTGDLLAAFDQQPGAPGTAKPLTEAENAEVVAAVRAVTDRYASPDLGIRVTGPPVLADFFNRAIGHDVGIFMSLAFLAFAVLLLILFRRFSGALLPLAVVVLSLGTTVGLLALYGAPFTSVTSILPSFIMSVGVGSSVHVLAIFYRRYQESGDKEAAVIATFAHSGLPIVMTGLTTAAGLFSFATAGIAPVADLGRFGGLGVLVILAFTLIALPALIAALPLRPRPRFGKRAFGAGMDGLLVGIADFATRNARAVVLGSVLVIATAGAGLAYQGFGHHFTKWLKPGSPERVALETMDTQMKGAATLEVVVDTGRENGLYEPAVMRAIEQLSAFAQVYRGADGLPIAGKVTSVLDVLKETHQALNENRAAFYAVPDQRELIAQELLLFENSGSDDLQRLVDSRFSMARVSIKVRDRDATDYTGFIAAVQHEGDRLFTANGGKLAGVTITGTGQLWSETVTLVMRSIAESYAIAAVVITALMMIMLGSVRIGLLSMVPNIAPIAVTLGLMGWAGVKLDMSNMLLGTVAIGLAVDDTIHFFHNFRSYYTRTGDTREAVRQTMLTTGRAMLFSTLVLTIGFGLFVFASLVNLVQFGVLIAFTLVLALLADVLLAPAMMQLIMGTRRGKQMLLRWGGTPAVHQA